jgi:methylmalonyl-CoA epimerase
MPGSTPPATSLGTVDHIAIRVRDTDVALMLYRHALGLRIIHSEILDDQHVRLTHLDLGGCDLQLVEPLVGHAEYERARDGVDVLHHVCLFVDDLEAAAAGLVESGLALRDASPRSGPRGRRAIFLNPASTNGVLLELTADGTSGSDRGTDDSRRADRPS